jgi:hypothetical protein
VSVSGDKFYLVYGAPSRLHVPGRQVRISIYIVSLVKVSTVRQKLPDRVVSDGLLGDAFSDGASGRPVPSELKQKGQRY